MARKKEATSLKVLLTEFKELKNIDEETMLHVLEEDVYKRQIQIRSDPL